MTPELNPPERRQSGEVDRGDPSKTRRVNDESMETNDDTGGRNLDSLSTEALGLNAMDQLIIGKALQGSYVLELYVLVRVNAVAAKFGLVPGMRLEFANGYDFDEKKDPDNAWEVIRRTQPKLAMGSPPCT